MYFKTYITGSPLKPTILNIVKGKDKEMNRNIFIFQLFVIKFKIAKTITYQMILKNAVE